MKRFIILSIAIIFGAFSANAQLGGFLDKAAKKAAKKTEEKIIEKATEKAAEKASEAIVNEIDFGEEPAIYETQEINSDEPLTYESLMRMLPEIPSAQQMVGYKKAELNGQGLKLIANPLMKFQMSVLELTGKVYTVPYQGADSTQIMEAAYKNAELYTGLTKEEIDMLSTMSEEEQEAYLQTHYQEGRAEAVMLEQAAELGEEMEPLQPIIDRWSAFDDKITANNDDADAQCRTIYAKYADRLAKTVDDDEAHNKILLSYYEEVAPIIRENVIKNCKVRLDEQLPVAMEIDEQMVPIRARHQNALSALLNYPQLTAAQYFTEALKVLEVPEFPEE
ncbi:MAG: hypothetical protein J6X10_08070 [Bacteroidales bacterium]|nr:hypothetical protein [Bacteroidales bacterium]